MHPLFILAFATFALIAGFLIWNRVSAGRHSFGANPSGVGGANDPLSGATDDMREPEALRGSLDDAAAKPTPVRQTR